MKTMLNAESMTLISNPLFQAVWFMPGSNHNARMVQRDHDLQVHYFQWAYARFQILSIARERGIVVDRDLSTSVPAKVRQWAASDLNTLGLIEKEPYGKSQGWVLTQSGRDFLLTFS